MVQLHLGIGALKDNSNVLSPAASLTQHSGTGHSLQRLPDMPLGEQERLVLHAGGAGGIQLWSKPRADHGG